MDIEKIKNSVEEEMYTNACEAAHHEGSEIVIKVSRVVEILNESKLLTTATEQARQEGRDSAVDYIEKEYAKVTLEAGKRYKSGEENMRENAANLLLALPDILTQARKPNQ